MTSSSSTGVRRYPPKLENIGLELLRGHILGRIDAMEEELKKDDTAIDTAFSQGYILGLNHILDLMDTIAGAQGGER